MNINWDELKDQYGGNYAGVGKYKVKVKNVVMSDKNGNSCRVDINYEKNDGLSYPKTSYFLSFKEDAKVGWRQLMAMTLMKELSGSEEDAKKVVENIESKDGNEAIIKEYHASFKRLGEKHREVEIEVYSELSDNGLEYTRSQLTADNKLSTKRSPKKEKKIESVDDLGGEEIKMDEISF